MSDKKSTEHKKIQQKLRETRLQKNAAKLRLSLYNQLDSHKWESKMEIFRLLSS